MQQWTTIPAFFYRLKKWKEQHSNEDEPPFPLFPFPTAKKNPEKRSKWIRNINRLAVGSSLGINYLNLGKMQGFAVFTFLMENQQPKILILQFIWGMILRKEAGVLFMT